jgi:hypothetical protein
MNSDLTGDASVPLTDDPGNETIVNGNTIIKVIKQVKLITGSTHVHSILTYTYQNGSVILITS